VGQFVVLLWLMLCCRLILHEWVWAPNPDTGYSVGGFYHMLTRLYPRETSAHDDLI
jgi:hypothetical protein